jgi:hypothetical protein
MKLKRLERYLDDLAYIIGIVFISFDHYLANGLNDKKS